MATLLEIYNAALGNLGIQQSLLTTAETTSEAIACNRFYQQALETVLTDFPWPFATKWTKLQILSDSAGTPRVPTADWQYVLNYPSDCLQLRSLVLSSGGLRPLNGWSHQLRVPYTIGQLASVFSVTISQSAAQADPASTSPVLFTATFSDPINVSTFTTADVVLSGTATGMSVSSILEVVPNNGTTFQVTVAVIGAGTVIAKIAVGTITSALGLSNDASTITDSTITYTPPSGFVLSGRYTLDPGSAPPGNLFVTITETNSGQVINAPGTTVLNTFIPFTFPTMIAAGTPINVTFVVTPGAAFTAFPYTTIYPATMPAANTTRDFSLQR